MEFEREGMPKWRKCSLDGGERSDRIRGVEIVKSNFGQFQEILELGDTCSLLYLISLQSLGFSFFLKQIQL